MSWSTMRASDCWPALTPAQPIHTRTGPPTPDDMDELLCRRRKTRFFLAHPRAITAFGRECSRRGIYPDTAELDGRPVGAWRGVLVLPSPAVPVSDSGTTFVLAMRTSTMWQRAGSMWQGAGWDEGWRGTQ